MSITKQKIDNLLTLLQTSGSNGIKLKMDALQLLLKQGVSDGTATITISEDIVYDDDGITVKTENKTDLSIDPNDRTQFVVKNTKENVNRNKILFKK